MTKECLKTIGNLQKESEKLKILMITGSRTEVGIGSSYHCLLGRV